MPEISQEQWDKVIGHITSTDQRLGVINGRLNDHADRLRELEAVQNQAKGAKAMGLILLAAIGSIGGLVGGFLSKHA